MLKKISLLTTLVIFIVIYSKNVYANSIIDFGINYLKSNQDGSGKITGYGGESQWAAIALSENNINVSEIKQSEKSLKDFLLSDKSTSTSLATEWERKILAIVAIGDDPTNFGELNYLQNLESMAKDHQIGDVSQLNDDIFGLLALIASGTSANQQIKQDALDFIITHQNSDGGFSWSTNPNFNTSDSNDTAAAIQALQAAKNDGLINNNLDISINNAKNYLLTLQTSTGGFKYDNLPWTTDADGSSTAWVLMTFNVLGLSNSPEAIIAKSWLNAQQETDGGFHWMNGSGVDTSTTSYALIALSGNGLLYQPNKIIPTPTPSTSLRASPTPIVSITNTPTPTPTPSASSGQAPTPIPTPTQNSGCQDAKPGSAPIITSAEISNSNEVVINWSKANDPVSYYSVAYGTSQDIIEYGAPNIGDKNTTSYTIGSLSKNTTYYFKVRAGNGCTPGDFSNTAIVIIEPHNEIPRIILENEKIPSPTPEILGASNQINTNHQPIQNSSSTNNGMIGFSLLSFVGAIGYWALKLRT